MSRKSFSLIACPVFVFSLIVTPFPALAEETGTVSGFVLSENGDPIAGLWVDACEYDAGAYCASAETGLDGKFSIDLPPGDYWVQVWVDRDWISQVYDVDPQDGIPDRVAVVAGQDTAGINFQLLIAGNITGRVTDEFGNPVPDIWVDACEYDTQSFCASAPTDEDGYYIIPVLPGYYWVQVWAEGYVGKFYKDDEILENAKRVKVKLGKDTHKIDFSLEIE